MIIIKIIITINSIFRTKLFRFVERDTVFFAGSVSDNVKKGKSGDKYGIKMPPVNSSPRALIPRIRNHHVTGKHFDFITSVDTLPPVTTSARGESRNSTSNKLFLSFLSTASTLPPSASSTSSTSSFSSSNSPIEFSFLQHEDNVLESEKSDRKTLTPHQQLQLMNPADTNSADLKPADMKQIGQISRSDKNKNKNEIQQQNEVENAGNRNRNHSAVSPDIREACSTMGGAHESILLLESGYDTVMTETSRVTSNHIQNENEKEFAINNRNQNKYKNHLKNQNQKYSENNFIERFLNFFLWMRVFLRCGYTDVLNIDRHVHTGFDAGAGVDVDVDVEAGVVCEIGEVQIQRSETGTLGPVEKQLIGIARGLLRRPHLLLFDDVASSMALDVKEVSKVENCLASIYDSRLGEETTIVVSEKMSAISHADIIIVMDQGRVAGQGTHDELMNLNGWYCKRWEAERQADLRL